MKLHEAFGITRGEVVSFIGAGGKTAALIGVGYELSDQGWRVLATTTTTISQEQLQLMPHVMRATASPQAISSALSDRGFVFLYQRIVDDQVYGVAPDRIRTLIDSIDSDVLLIEADGAAGLPFKAPYEHEPVIPPESTLVVPIASLGALDQPLDEDHVYNPQAMIEKFGFYPGGAVRSPWIAQVLRDETLGLRGIPERARVTAFINQTPESGYLRQRARLIAKLALKSPRLHAVALGSVRGAHPVLEVQRSLGAVVLAAGQASRMGQPKVLLPWSHNRSIIEHIIHQLNLSRLHQINVVTGYYADRVKPLVKAMGAKPVHNRAYKTGGMISSLKAGLRAMPDHIGAVLLVLGDQPRIQSSVIYRLMRAYAEGEGDLIAPSYQMRRGHPILIDRKYWPDFLSLRNNETPRSVFETYANAITYIKVDTDSVLADVDTPADYQAERTRAGLTRKPPPQSDTP